MFRRLPVPRDWNELPLAAYADRMSVHPGETIRFFVSAHDDGVVNARIVQATSDPRDFCPLDGGVVGARVVQRQHLSTGSYAALDRAALAEFPDDIAVTFGCATALPASGKERGLFTWTRDAGVFIDANGHLCARYGGAQIVDPRPLVAHEWTHVCFAIDPARRTLSLSRTDAGAREWTARQTFGDREKMLGSVLRISGWEESGRTRGCFDGKIAGPRVESASAGTVARWRFDLDVATSRVPDESVRGLDLLLHQHPRRAVTGPHWDGRTWDYRSAPSQYDAIAFHSDDLTDSGWSETFSWRVPETLPSDVYALELQSDRGTDHVPFVVTPARRTGAKVMLILPTFSYLCYANEHHWWDMPDATVRAGGPLEDVLSAGEKWAYANRLLSCYDRHVDGSGCTHSSYLRPILNYRAGYVHPYTRAPHQLSADLLIVEWLRRMGEPFAVLSDHDLHADGVQALEGASVVLTGSHPEYVSASMMDALHAFVRGGGNLMYLGGNGFHNVVSTYVDAPHVLELRRGHAGGAHWKSAPGEAHHASTGEPGGRWRLRGAYAHALVGVGTASVSFDKGRPYKRTAHSYLPEFAWIFAGVDGDCIDVPGRVLGAPGGFEYDRMEHAFGTPPNAVCLAIARFEPAVTEYTREDERWTATTAENRADLTFVPASHGRGAVFSVGSIAWTGCLPTAGDGGAVGRITRNVLERFKDSVWP